MNIWPLIQRELQVGARRRSTHWLRVVVALVATVIGAIFAPNMFRGATMAPGMGLFLVLVWIAFGITGLFGVFFASDVISSERREGTLGLLFLTRLRGIDVILGKLFSTSARATFSLMAAVPVLALPILLGGVTFKAYAHAALVLGNTLFLSVSIGLMVSSFNRDPVRTVLVTLFFTLVFTGGTFWIDVAWSGFNWNQFVPRLSLASPAYVLHQGILGSPKSMWVGLGIQHALLWIFLGIAAWRTSRHTEKGRETTKTRRLRWILFPRENRSSRQLRDNHPVQWLVSHHSRGPTIVALVVCAVVGVVFAFQYGSAADVYWVPFASSVISGITALFSFVLFLWITVDAVRRIGDSRTSGALELLMATPLTDREILTGFVRGTIGVFRIPIIALIILLAISLWVTVLNWMNIVGSQPNMGSMWPNAVRHIVDGAFGIVNTVTLAGAIIWVGTWLGLKSERTSVAAGVTYILVVVVPAFLIAVAASLAFFSLQMAYGLTTMWVSPLISGTARFAVNISFIVWARRQSMKHFRDAANGTFRRKPFKRFSRQSVEPPPLPT